MSVGASAGVGAAECSAKCGVARPSWGWPYHGVIIKIRNGHLKRSDFNHSLTPVQEVICVEMPPSTCTTAPELGLPTEQQHTVVCCFELCIAACSRGLA